MAREESDREDLLREATALVERIELAPVAAESDEHVVIGFRVDGALSVFFGGEPVYQFNTAHCLRRAYCDGRLLKADHGRLVSLERIRTEGEVQLVRHELSDDEQTSFVTRMRDRLSELARQLGAEQLAVVGQVPPDANVLERVREWLAEHDGLPIADSPRVHAATCEQNR